METALIVQDIDAVRDFYVDGLGFTLAGSYRSTDLMFERAGLGSPLSIAFLDDTDGSRLKIISRTGTTHATPAATVTAESGRSLITVFRDDLDAAVAKATHARASRLGDQQEIQLPTGRRMAFLRDPEGNAVEIIQLE